MFCNDFKSYTFWLKKSRKWIKWKQKKKKKHKIRLKSQEWKKTNIFLQSRCDRESFVFHGLAVNFVLENDWFTIEACVSFLSFRFSFFSFSFASIRLCHVHSAQRTIRFCIFFLVRNEHFLSWPFKSLVGSQPQRNVSSSVCFFLYFSASFPQKFHHTVSWFIDAKIVKIKCMNQLILSIIFEPFFRGVSSLARYSFLAHFTYRIISVNWI